MFNSSFQGLCKCIFEVHYLKNVFDVGAEISTDYSVTETFRTPKRSAFIFITTDSDASALTLEDLRKIDEVKEVYSCPRRILHCCHG